MARSWAWQLSWVRSARMAMVRARRQWMILSSVDSVGMSKVGCMNTTVSEITTACVVFLITL
jgi:hypothetical protein